jgi:CheY-like chemotaxis protein
MLGIGEKQELPIVFLIDDDLVSREVIATVLTLHGHLVHTAETGDGALEMLAAGAVTPGVVLMDAQLPGLKGTELIGKLREGCDAEIILISGSQPADDLVEAADGFMMKPVVTDLHKRQEALEKAISEENSEDVRRIGHAIKGGCGMAGAMQAARIGATFESKSDQLDNCAAALEELYTATQRLERMLEKEFPA